jgi:hypothetical protein
MSSSKAYVETFAWHEEHPSGMPGFLCSICRRPVDLEPCPDHAPTDVPGWNHGDGCNGCMPTGSLHWRGKRVYILGAHRNTWRCWRQRHRPGDPIGFGFCAKCMPCPACGSKTAGHNDGCVEGPMSDMTAAAVAS